MKNLKSSPVFETISSIVGIPVETLMEMALVSVADMAARGMSNRSIAKTIGISTEDVVEDLVELGEFTGFVTDLDFSPIKLYLNSGCNMQGFIQALTLRKFHETESVRLLVFLENLLNLKDKLSSTFKDMEG